MYFDMVLKDAVIDKNILFKEDINRCMHYNCTDRYYA